MKPFAFVTATLNCATISLDVSYTQDNLPTAVIGLAVI